MTKFAILGALALTVVVTGCGKKEAPEPAADPAPAAEEAAPAPVEAGMMTFPDFAPDEPKTETGDIPVAEDLEEQLSWLFRGRFAWYAGFQRLLEMPWHLQAIQSRLGRIESLPIGKDLEKLETFRKHWEPWFKEWTAEPENPKWWAHGWLLEDWRAVFFAPDLKCPRKSSEKRVHENFSKLLETV